MVESRKNLAASVLARLLAQARETGDDYQILVTRYVTERFLYRLSVSRVRDRFVLKGAVLLRVWLPQPYRATRDLDLLHRGDGSPDTIRGEIEEILAMEVEPDGVAFDPDSIRIETIRTEDEYSGLRATIRVRCGTYRSTLQVDIGVADAVWPPASTGPVPCLLGMPEPSVLAYSRDSVVAEKLEAIIVLGDRNSRIKDFFDLKHLAENFGFDRPTLAEAVRRTLERRKTALTDEEPFGLTEAFWDSPGRSVQIRAFARRAGLDVDAAAVKRLPPALRSFLLPILEDVHRGRQKEGTWTPQGPWKP
jgi:predicted nucleotidyltransferase component of viral defense system